MIGTNIFAFIVVLGVLIFFHELGHFLAARLFGVGVEKFSLGFGPRLVGKKVGITDYRISAIPLGGYVKMVGEEPDAELSPEQIPLSFTHKNVFKRILIVAAGPFFNLLLAVLIFFGIFISYGVPVVEPVIGEVTAGMPADEAGLQTGDRIVAINGTQVERWEEMAQFIQLSDGKPLDLQIRRGDQALRVTVEPRPRTEKILGTEVKTYLIGISNAETGYVQKLNFFQAVREGVARTYNVAELTIVSIVKMLQGTLSAKTLGGPIMIAQIAGQQAQSGVIDLIAFIALISVNLAIINFLPIPVLDGGHLLFFAIEAVIGHPVSQRVREIALQMGLFLLVMLTIFVIYNDIARIITS